MKFSKSYQPKRCKKSKRHTPYETMRYAAETGNVGLYNEACYQSGNTDLFVPAETSRNAPKENES